ncbi:MAG: replication initiation protein [Treponema sp.]|nr:replication initiation protein [Treponema sp.]
MQDELFEVNTTETLGVTPRYILQHNAISRSAHNFSATAKKLTAMAMSLLPPDLSSLSAAFTFTEFCDALGYTKSGKSFSLFKAAVKECMESVIEVKGPKTVKGKTPWIMHHWFQRAEFNPDTGVCTMTFDQDLADFLKELKRLYAKISLTDMGRLQSRYALRIYEIALSYKSLQGKEGNAENAWYIERTLEELRKLFGIQADEYQETYVFRRKVIEGPVREINDAGIGVKIKTESIKKGRNIAGFRFACETVAKTTEKKRQGRSTRVAVALPEPRTAMHESKIEKENQLLRERYPQAFADLYKKALAELPTFGRDSGESLRKRAAEGKAINELRVMHGIVQ